MTQQPLRAAIYARTSTTDQDPGLQLDEIRDYIKARGWRTSKHLEFIDEGVSGARHDRKQFDLMWRDAKARRFDVLVCWSIDRLGRSVPHVSLFLADCIALNVQFVCLREGVDITIPSGLFVAQVVAAHAELERALTCQRVRAGLARARRRGVVLGRRRKSVAPYVLDRMLAEKWSMRKGAKYFGVSPSTLYRRLKDYKAKNKEVI